MKSGSGKTYLVRKIGETVPGSLILSYQALVEARLEKIDKHRCQLGKRFCSCRLLIIEDVDFLEGK